MDLIRAFIENIYKYGNIRITLSSNWQNIEYYVYVDNNQKLNITTKYNDYEYDDDIDENCDKEIDFSLINILALLIEIDLNTATAITKKVEFSFQKKEINPDKTILAINIIYQKLLPLILVNYDNMKNIIEAEELYSTIVNSYASNVKNAINEPLILSYDTIYHRLLRKTKAFKKTFNQGIAYFKDHFQNYKYKQFLAKLYVDQYIKKTASESTVELNSIDIDYEFLTDKLYQTDPAIGREAEIKDITTTLLTPSKSALLVGPPGTGKTAIVEGIAHRIRTKQIPSPLANKRILKVTTSSIIRGCSLVGLIEEKIETLMNYLTENPDTILFIDEMHTTIGSGTGNNSNLDLANMIKPYLDRGQIKIMGATTTDEYEKYMSTDEAYRRRFIKTIISEPDNTLLSSIISENILKYEKQTSINWEFDSIITNYIINKLIECTKEKNRIYNDKRYNPDLVLLIIELVFANALREGNRKITINNITEAIKNCSLIYPSIREKTIQEIMFRLGNIQESHNIRARKIIPFKTAKS